MLDLNQWLLMQSDMTVYGVIFALLLTGALGFPPEDFSLILAGICLHQGKGDLDVMYVLCYVGTILGDLFIYGVGRWFGRTLFAKEWFQRRVRPGRIKLIRVGLEKRRFWMIFVARHLFYLRTVTFLTCGAVKMRFLKFLIADCLSAVVSVSIMLFLGYQASEHYGTIFSFLGKAKLFSLLLVVATCFVLLYLYYRHRRKLEEKCPAVTPLGNTPAGDGDESP